MEVILASIRRCIADEEPGDSAAFASACIRRPPNGAVAAGSGGEEEDRFDVGPAQEGPRQRRCRNSRLRASGPRSRCPPLAAAFREARPSTRRCRPSEERRGLVSAATTEAVDAAFDTLAQAVQVRNGRTVEELVSELIRPMLKTWLDDNLPGLVERLVRAEIERVSRRRGE
jgi:cell pole-organizing protein PopZ